MERLQRRRRRRRQQRLAPSLRRQGGTGRGAPARPGCSHTRAAVSAGAAALSSVPPRCPQLPNAPWRPSGSGLLSGLWPRLPPAPGTHEAHLEQTRLGALLDQELRKPAGQRDEELVHKLRVDYRTLQLQNAQVGGPPAASAAAAAPDAPQRQEDAQAAGKLCTIAARAPFRALQAKVRKYTHSAACFEHSTRQCCIAAGWAAQRVAASYRALTDYYEQVVQQVGGIGGAAALARLRLGLPAPDWLPEAPASPLVLAAACTALLLSLSTPAPPRPAPRCR